MSLHVLLIFNFKSNKDAQLSNVLDSSLCLAGTGELGHRSGTSLQLYFMSSRYLLKRAF